MKKRKYEMGEQINDKLYLTENINMVKVEPLNYYKGE